MQVEFHMARVYTKSQAKKKPIAEEIENIHVLLRKKTKAAE